MKNIIIVTLLIVPLLFASCGEEFLDTENLTEKDLGNYYSNQTDVSEALTGIYSTLPLDFGANHPILVANILSDDCFSGGGTNDIQTIAMDQFEFVTEDQYLNLYQTSYSGIGRANALIEAFINDQPQFDEEEDKKQALGEAYFLRAYLYFRLAKFFGEVPLDLNTDLDFLGKSTASEIYAQIASDLKLAIENLQPNPYTVGASETRGHASKWAAEALMARVYLFYTGYYGQSTLPSADGGTVTQSDVVGWLEDLMQNSGHELVPDYRSLWPYSELEENVDGYFYANDVTWAGDGNIESVFAIKYSPYGDWGNTGRLSFSNQLSLFTSMRQENYLPPFGNGWGIGSVNPQLRDSYEAADPRRLYTIIDNMDANEGTVADGSYVWGFDNCANETGLWNKKYTSIVRDLDDPATTDENEAGDGSYSGMFYFMYGGNDNNQLFNMQDDVMIRYADVLLMHSELTGTNTGLNLVRARVGLPAVAYSLDAIKAERRHELALEGHRWFDLLRWGDAETAINSANGQVSVRTVGNRHAYEVSFNPNRVFVKIPESEVALSQGNLEQNPGWAN